MCTATRHSLHKHMARERTPPTKTWIPFHDDAKLERLLSHFLIASVRLRQVEGARLRMVARD